MRKQRAFLHDEADIAAMRRHAGLGIGDQLPIEADFARVGNFKAGNEAQQRGLAGARRADDGGARALGDIEVEIDQRPRRAEALAEAP